MNLQGIFHSLSRQFSREYESTGYFPLIISPVYQGIWIYRVFSIHYLASLPGNMNLQGIFHSLSRQFSREYESTGYLPLIISPVYQGIWIYRVFSIHYLSSLPGNMNPQGIFHSLSRQFTRKYESTGYCPFIISPVYQGISIYGVFSIHYLASLPGNMNLQGIFHSLSRQFTREYESTGIFHSLSRQFSREYESAGYFPFIISPVY